MSIVFDCGQPQKRRRRPRRLQNHTPSRLCVVVTRRSQPHIVDDTAFWERLAEREEGRFALEADHLFDTSFAWAE